MPVGGAVVFTGAVEGTLDEFVLRRVVQAVGGRLGRVYGRQGKGFLLTRLAGFNEAARLTPWIVLVDLDQDCDCAPACVARWLPDPAEGLHLRVAVRAIESWLLADRDTLAPYLGIGRSHFPDDPDGLDDPKAALVALARGSRRRAIARDMVPRQGSGRSVGPRYTSRMIDYVTATEGGWRPGVAASASDSLARTLARLALTVGGRLD